MTGVLILLWFVFTVSVLGPASVIIALFDRKWDDQKTIDRFAVFYVLLTIHYLSIYGFSEISGFFEPSRTEAQIQQEIRRGKAIYQDYKENCAAHKRKYPDSDLC